MRGKWAIGVLFSLPVLAARPVVPREPFAKAHVSMMARVQAGRAEARLAEIDLWAEGARLRARVRGDPQAGEFWVDGLFSEALHLRDGKVAEPRKDTLEHGLKMALAPSPSLANANTDRIAGHPCKIVTQSLGRGASLTRCIWRGLPLSVELESKGFAFNAAATMVEEGAVALADLQPPAGAPAAPASLTATR
jgi:hypothetical protein